MAISASGHLGRRIAPNSVHSVRQSGSTEFGTFSRALPRSQGELVLCANLHGRRQHSRLHALRGRGEAGLRNALRQYPGEHLRHVRQPLGPSTSLYVLTNPSSLSARTTNTVSADAGASRLPNTTYAAVFEVTSASKMNS